MHLPLSMSPPNLTIPTTAITFVPAIPLVFHPRVSLCIPRRPSVTHIAHVPRASLASAQPERIRPSNLSSSGSTRSRIVLICGFETFNLGTYHAAAQQADSAGIDVTVATDQQLESKDSVLSQALQLADVVFCSLVFDFDQVEWLQSQLPSTATVFVFESALELMSCTVVGSFRLATPDTGGGGGMPPAIRTVLRKLGLVGREEDKLAGYLALLKSAPRLLRLLPGERVRDLRHWLTVYSYWNAGGVDNVAAMLEYITRDVLQSGAVGQIPPVKQIPNVGLLHPVADGFFEHPAEYMRWYQRTFPERSTWPRVAVLLYRKHVVSELRYIPKLIAAFEEACLIPIPVFITGVEAHIIVRDYLTSKTKETRRANGERMYGSYRRGKTAMVDAVVSTIG